MYRQIHSFILGKIFNNGPSKICERKLLKKSKWYGLLTSNFLKVLFHIFYLVHSFLEYFTPYVKCKGSKSKMYWKLLETTVFSSLRKLWTSLFRQRGKTKQNKTNFNSWLLNFEIPIYFHHTEITFSHTLWWKRRKGYLHTLTFLS